MVPKRACLVAFSLALLTLPALAAYPGYVAGYRGLGLAYAQAGDRTAALDAFKTYVKLAPTAKDVELVQKRIRNLSIAH